MLIPEETPRKGEAIVLCNVLLFLCSYMIYILYRQCLISFNHRAFNFPQGLQSFLSFNCHFSVNGLILVKIEAAAAVCETECSSKKISPCYSPKFCATVKNLFEFLLYLKFMQQYCLFKFYIFRCQYINFLIANNPVG